MLLFAIVGMPGAGKSSVAGYLKSKGFPVIRLGEIVTSEVTRRGLPLSPQAEREIREELRSKYGMDVMAKLSMPRIRVMVEQATSIVIDGLYSFAEYKTFKQIFGSAFVVIAVAAQRSLRYQRLSQRPERPLSVMEAEERDFREIETLEKGGPIAIADYTVLNDEEVPSLHSKVDQVLERLVSHTG